MHATLRSQPKSGDFATLQVQHQIEMSEQAGALVVGHSRLRTLLLVPDAGQCIAIRDDR
jgi:hypothetical protein